MPQNKAASIRHRVMDQCFRNPGRKYFWQDLAKACTETVSEYTGKDIASISRRTILNDMNYLRSEAGGAAPIIGITDNGKKYYTYEDKSFSIFNTPLNTMEMDQLKDAAFLFSRIGGLEQFEWIKDILPKLQIAVDDKIDDNIIDYDNNLDLKNNNLVPELFNHIRYKRALTINYKTFAGEILNVVFHPHLLKQYNNRWFMFGEVTDLRENDNIHPVNFALDRIVSADASKETYKSNKDIDYEAYFDDFIGVTKEGVKSHKIEFSVHKRRYKYLESKPLHLTQKEFKQIDDSDWYNSSINVIPNRELYQTIMSFGSDMVVNSPAVVRDKVKAIALSMMDNYK